MILPLQASSYFAEVDVMDPDVHLMLAVRDGNEDAFAELFRRYQPAVRRMVSRFSRQGVAVEDTVQEVFLRVYCARHRYEPKSKLITWLSTITRNVALNATRTQRREHRRREALFHRNAMQDEPSQTPEATLSRHETRDLVLNALECLGERHRRAIHLYAIEGMSYKDVAEEMQISTTAVKSLLHRARANLREKLRHTCVSWDDETP